MSLICVSLGLDDPQQLRAEHAALASRGCRLVEYRLDYLPPGTDVARLVGERPGPIIATVRRPEDGGRWQGEESARRAMLETCIDAGAEYVDLEPDAAKAIPRRGATQRIVSAHNFQDTPADLRLLHAKLAACDADVVKLATMAKSVLDNFRMFRLMREATVPTVGLCMGELGAASRILGAKYGAPWSYAAADEESAVAPGQISFDVLRELYRYESIGPATPAACVIGDPIAHSRSPLIHNRALQAVNRDGVYVAFRVAPAELDEFVAEARALGLQGVSVTIPHKEAVLRHVTKLDEAAADIGAVNTLVFAADGATHGYNTDEPGALDALEALEPMRGRKALVLGAGGAAKGVVCGLVRRGASVTIANRTRERADELAQATDSQAVDWDARGTADYDVLVNCTSIGMHPKIDETPLPAERLRSGAIVFDTVYNPVETRLLREAGERGCRVVVGTEMFVRQAARQFELFFGAAAPLEAMRAALSGKWGMGNGEWGVKTSVTPPFSIQHSAFSISDSPLVLIGYRGTGKTTTARLLALKLGWDWVDADVEIELRAGKSIKQIFADDGEPRFRDLEAEVLADLLQRRRTVVACGGGAVMRDANRALLRDCPQVVWLRGSAEVLERRIAGDATTSARRPNLTAGGGRSEIETLLTTREPWYRECAKLVINTDELTPEQTAAAVLQHLGAERTSA